VIETAEPSVLVVPPEHTFAALDAALIGLGWQRDERHATTAPLVAGEPELAGWRRGGRGAAITYTFNPVVQLRVLELGALAPSLRASIERTVPHLTPVAVRTHLRDASPRRRLLALFAARELALVDLLPEVESLRDDPDPAVAKGAAATREALARSLAARTNAAVALGLLVGTATPRLLQLATLDGAASIASLQPTLDDCRRIFRDDLAEAVASAYAKLWAQPPKIAVDPDLRVEVHACPAALLGQDHVLSRPFPQGYRVLAPYLVPSVVWICWRYLAYGATRGVAYDGLVCLGERWTWCPQPYRVVGEILRARGEITD
jgi:hypothetical protein